MTRGPRPLLIEPHGLSQYRRQSRLDLERLHVRIPESNDYRQSQATVRSLVQDSQGTERREKLVLI
jgi:hypothetical protein